MPRLVNWGLSSYPPSGSPAGLLSILSYRDDCDAFRAWAWNWAGPEPREGDLAWKRKRRVVAEEEEDDGWKCDEEE